MKNIPSLVTEDWCYTYVLEPFLQHPEIYPNKFNSIRLILQGKETKKGTNLSSVQGKRLPGNLTYSMWIMAAMIIVTCPFIQQPHRTSLRHGWFSNWSRAAQYRNAVADQNTLLNLIRFSESQTAKTCQTNTSNFSV